MFGKQFYPTPPNVIHRMLSKVSKEANYFLDPSAGKGDIAQTIINRNYHKSKDRVDCIESDPDLAALLIGKGLNVVGTDWLTYPGVCFYDAIVMNPPFSDGDTHLLRAWDFLHHGEIVCLLNEETIDNPYSKERKQLLDIIATHGNIERLGDAFLRSERTTNVRVVLVYLKKESEDDQIDLWANHTDERVPDGSIGPDECSLALRDNLGNMQHYYDKANEHMLKAIAHIRKASIYMSANEIGQNQYGRNGGPGVDKILEMAMKNTNSARAEFSRMHRRGAWFQVFHKMQFRKWLDKKQVEEFLRDIEANANIPFTKENIIGTLENVFSQRRKLFEKSVANVFDELTRFYAGNTTASAGGGGNYSGWKSNDSFKVNEKLVFPYGCRYDRDFASFKIWHSQSSVDIYNDLDRIVCVLDGKDFEKCRTINDAMHEAFANLDKRRLPFGTRGSRATWTQADQVAQSEYFDIRFYQKGTVHLKWRRTDLWEKFNITAAAGKKWIGENTQQERTA